MLKNRRRHIVRTDIFAMRAFFLLNTVYYIDGANEDKGKRRGSFFYVCLFASNLVLKNIGSISKLIRYDGSADAFHNGSFKNAK